eukprot:scaffold5807_cov412-Prasinococcus_capsulatus_cf.AAC.7
MRLWVRVPPELGEHIPSPGPKADLRQPPGCCSGSAQDGSRARAHLRPVATETNSSGVSSLDLPLAQKRGAVIRRQITACRIPRRPRWPPRKKYRS